MQPTSDRSTRAAALRLALLSLSLLFGLLACMTGKTPVNGWWAGRGPVVPHDTFPADCALCHEGGSWTKLRADFQFDHLAETGVPLEGAHAEAECLRCHNDRGPVERFAARGCAGCHEDPHRAQLGDDCSVCHDQNDWSASEELAQHARTRFPLVGAHAQTACWRCHGGAQVGNFQRADTECLSCHAEDLARAKSPDHQMQGWVAQCDRCHIPTTWTDDGFNHSAWPLTGRHRTLNCDACHAGGVFTGTPTDCFACHADDYNSQSDHVNGNFPTDCSQCHNTSSWGDADFLHPGITTGCDACHIDQYKATTNPPHGPSGYPTTCEDCHRVDTWVPANFDHQGTAGICVQCHLADYQGTTDPDHQAQGFATTCDDCHITDSWVPAFFDHGGISTGCAECHLDDYQATTQPDHQLLGLPTTCEDCHNTKFWVPATFDHSGVTNGCVQCHLSDYQGTTNPDHELLNLPTTCEQCHSTRSWIPASFDHTGVTSNCVQCHLADYKATTDPNHIQLGIPTTCENCHNTNAWIPADFDHAGITNNCVQCHLTDYKATTDPNHIAAGFPTQCELCHNTNTWFGATFNHDFPITNGHHAGFDCSDCHLNPNDFGQFSCIDCHEHNQADMADEHHGVNGYVWESNACLACHPNGDD